MPAKQASAVLDSPKVKAIIAKSDLARIVKSAGSACARNTAVMILSQLRLEFTPDLIRATGCDGHRWMISSAKCACPEMPPAMLEASRLSAAVEAMPSGDVTIERTERGVTLSGGGVTASLACGLDAQDFPDMPEVDGPFEAIPAKHLSDGLESVRRAVGTEKARQILCGVFLTGDRFVATDSCHLIAYTAPQPWPFDPCVIPSDGVAVLVRMCEGGAINVRTTKALLWAETGDDLLCLTLTQGDYPNYERVIPSECDFGWEVGVEECRAAIKAASGLSEALENNGRRIRLSASEEGFTLEGRSEAGACNSFVSGVPFGKVPPDFVCALDARFGLNVLDSCGARGVRIGFTSASRPLRFDSENFVGVVMPMAVN